MERILSGDKRDDFKIEEAKTSTKSFGNIVSFAANTHCGNSRNYNEDRVSIIVNIKCPKSKDPKTWPVCSYFAIYDGHGGALCADFLKARLHKTIVE
jgi:protein phosphatase 2C family protein 2/3